VIFFDLASEFWQSSHNSYTRALLRVTRLIEEYYIANLVIFVTVGASSFRSKYFRFQNIQNARISNYSHSPNRNHPFPPSSGTIF